MVLVDVRFFISIQKRQLDTIHGGHLTFISSSPSREGNQTQCMLATCGFFFIDGVTFSYCFYSFLKKRLKLAYSHSSFRKRLKLACSYSLVKKGLKTTYSSPYKIGSQTQCMVSTCGFSLNARVTFSYFFYNFLMKSLKLPYSCISCL